MSEIAIYEGPGGQIEVRLDNENVWLTQAQLVELFGRDQSVISRHVRNVFADGELDRESNMQKMHIAGSDKPTALYNLDVIISIGYRVKSQEGIRFRQWSTRTLKEHLTRGYTLNRQRLEQNASELEAALQLVRKVAAGEALTTDQGRGLVDVIARYTQTFLLLQRYDEGLLTEPKGTAGGALPSLAEAQIAITSLKQDLIGRGDASELFGKVREDGLASILGNLDQSVFGEPAYPSIEFRASKPALRTCCTSSSRIIRSVTATSASVRSCSWSS